MKLNNINDDILIILVESIFLLLKNYKYHY